MNRYDFQKLASIRLAEAKTLFRDGKYEGCYYLAGYAVECGLKGCIARMMKRYEFPDRSLLRNGLYSHELMDLIRLAKLEAALHGESAGDPDFKRKWSIVKDWRVESRYEMPNRAKAEGLLDAVADRKHGILRWIKRYW